MEADYKVDLMLRYLLVVFLLLISHLVFAQLEREFVHIILDQQSLIQVKALDADNDGDIDLMASRRGYNGNILLYKNIMNIFSRSKANTNITTITLSLFFLSIIFAKLLV